MMQAFRPGCRLIHLAQDLPTVRQKLASCRRQRHAAVGARQQTGSHLKLQGLNLLAQRRLGDIQQRRRTTKMQLLRDGHKVAQMTQFNIHIFNVSFEIINILDRIFTFSYPDPCGHTRHQKSRGC
ncbi:hypothetical protein D3C76_1050870 [compost metagenome]